jgi:hypothetical protein
MAKPTPKIRGAAPTIPKAKRPLRAPAIEPPAKSWTVRLIRRRMDRELALWEHRKPFRRGTLFPTPADFIGLRNTLGIVRAPDKASAEAAAIEEFKLSPAQAKRLVITERRPG